MSPSLDPHLSLSNARAGNRPDAVKQELLRLIQSGTSIPDCLARFPDESEAINSLYAAHHQPAADETHIAESIDSISTIKSAELPAEAASRAPLPASPSRKLIERYEIHELVGSGSFGQVYRAYDPQLDLHVALKVPIRGAFQFPGERDRFFREARAAVAVRHPGICPVYDVGQTADGQCFLALGYIAGQSLAERLSRLGIPDQRTSARWIQQIAEAMAEAHQLGIIHRDLKPANIMLDSRSRPVIMDFGLARRDGSDDAALTQQGQILGTPAYMAPEQARGDQTQVGPASDIYSLGTILYELLTGERPYKGMIVEVLSQLGRTTPPTPRSLNPYVDEQLEAICLKAMSLEPSDRWATMDDFKTSLEVWLSAPLEAPGINTATLPYIVTTNTSSDQLDLKPQLATHWNLWRSWTNRIAIALVFAGIIFTAGIFYISTQQGTVRIEVQHPEVEVHVDGRTIELKHLEQPLTLWTGTHQLEVRHGKLVVETRSFQVEHGHRKFIKVDYTPRSTSDHSTDLPPIRPGSRLTSDSASPTEGVTSADLQHPKNEPEPSPSAVSPSTTRLTQTEGVTASGTKIGTPPKANVQTPQPVARVLTEKDRIAEWAFQHGGSIGLRLGTSSHEISKVDELPVNEYSLIAIRMPRAVAWPPEVRQQIAANPDWEFLELEVSHLTEADFQVISRMRNVTSLGLTGANIDSGQIQLISQMRGLTSLRLHGAKLPNLDSLTQLHKLTVLWIMTSPTVAGTPSQSAISLKAIEQFPNVTDLNLTGQSINIDDLAEIAKLPKLSRLHLNSTPLTDAGLDQLADCPSLQSVFFDRTEVTDSGVARFIEASHSRLYGISITDSGITDKGIQPLSKCAQLLDLNVAQTSVGDAGLAALAGCRRMSSLWLTNTRVTDAGIESLGDKNQLLTLDLCGTSITDKSIPFLTQFRRLNYLGLRGTRMTAKGVQQLQIALPQCRIDW